MSAANRRRGADAERAVVRYLTSCGYDARRYLAGDGKQPGDIDWHPLVVLEVKDVERSSWPAWCRQAQAAAKPDQVPVVVRRQRGIPDPGLWPARLPVNQLPIIGCRPTPMAGLGDLWVTAPFGHVVAAVEALDG